MFKEKKLKQMVNDLEYVLNRKEAKIRELELELLRRAVESFPQLPARSICHFCGNASFDKKKYTIFREGIDKVAVCNNCLKK